MGLLMCSRVDVRLALPRRRLALTLSEVRRIYFFEISLSLLHHFLMIALKMNNIAARSSPAPSLRLSVRWRSSGSRF